MGPHEAARFPGPGEAGHSIPGAGRARTGPAGEAVERVKLHTGAWVEHAGKLARESRPPAELLNHPGAARLRWPRAGARLVEREAVARVLSSVPGVWHQELSRPPGKLPAIEQPGPPGAHRGRRRASSMAPGAGQSCRLCGTRPASRPGEAGRVSCWPPGSRAVGPGKLAGYRVKLANRAPVRRLGAASVAVEGPRSHQEPRYVLGPRVELSSFAGVLVEPGSCRAVARESSRPRVKLSSASGH